MQVGDPDGHGRYAELTATDDGERLVCHECGQEKRALGTHAWHAHKITAAEYRRRHGLSTGTSLASPATRARFTAHVARHPHMLEVLAEHRDPDQARAANTVEARGRAQLLEGQRLRGETNRLGRPITPDEASALAAISDVAEWAVEARRLVDDGASIRSIAAGTGMHRSTVGARLARLAPARPDPGPSAETVERLRAHSLALAEAKTIAMAHRDRLQRTVVDAVAGGVTVADVARLTGLSTVTVHQWIRELA